MIPNIFLAQKNGANIKILKEVCDIKKLNKVSNTENMTVYDRCLKYVVKGGFEHDITQALKTIDSIDNSVNKNTTQLLTLKYNTLKYSNQLARKFVEHSINYKLEKLLIELTIEHPKLLYNDLTKAERHQTVYESDLKSFFEEFGFYLFSEKVKESKPFNLVDKTVKEFLNKLVDIPSLKNELRNFESYELHIGGGATFIRKSIFEKEIFYNVKYEIPAEFEPNIKIDTLFKSHYYPLYQNKEPIFLKYTLKPHNDINDQDKERLYLNRNIDRIIE
jgi:hypothetical protein